MHVIPVEWKAELEATVLSVHATFLLVPSPSPPPYQLLALRGVMGRGKRGQVTSCCFKAICAFRAKFSSAALASCRAVMSLRRAAVPVSGSAESQEMELRPEWHSKKPRS